jgi:hypothetical protein
VNEGNAEDWAKDEPNLKWYPIEQFAGIFDGQGHTISGIYGKSYLSSMGLFTETQKKSVIRNVSLVNSYFYSNSYTGTGTIVGSGGGTIDTVYSNAILEGESRYFGGLIGQITQSGNNTIINSWFDGVINMNTKYASHVGGIVGYVNILGAMNTVEHCLNTGTVASENVNIGGICGVIEDGSSLDVRDCLSVGAVSYSGTSNAGVGSVIGRLNGKAASAYIADTYSANEVYKTNIGANSGTLTGSVIPRSMKMLTGYGGYQWTSLDFDSYWAVEEDSTPVLRSFSKQPCDVTGMEKLFDISWFDADTNEFTIRTSAQLYGFAQLALTNDFAGKTVRLGDDIVLNKGEAKDWAANEPDNTWMPIGWKGSNTGKHFNGTFDGQGHTISGVYVKEEVGYLGLFAEVYKTGTVKNLKLNNSYIECGAASNTEAPTGSIAGRNLGVIDTVYSDAIVVNSSKYTGGITGMITGQGVNKITNCWFAGKIFGATNTGGILGGVHGGGAGIEATIEHCLNTGAITISDGMSQVGGLCGVVRQAATLHLTDSFNAGTFTGVGTVKLVGTGLGYVAEDSKGTSYAIVKDSYGLKEFSVNGTAACHGKMVGNVFAQDQVKMTGYGGYQWSTLNFKDYWSVALKGTPVLKSFAGNGPSVARLAKKIDISWYDADKKSFTITTSAQLYGFALLSSGYDFAGQTIKLGADITVNTGNASDWANNPPADTWTPIGYRGSNGTQHFSGTFDGQGHTISGLYAKEKTAYVGLFGEIYKTGVVKNVKLTNSYFECTIDKSEYGATGSIAGRNLGVIDTVYSDAIVVNSGKFTGGLVGMIVGEGAHKISNSWFAGEVHGTINTGGILGGIHGGAKNIKATIAHCLNTGKIIISDGASQVGGICGVVMQGANLYLADSLNAGTYEKTGTVKVVGSAIGYVAKDAGGISSAVIENSYGVREFATKGIAACHGTTTGIVYVLKTDAFKGQDGYRWTKLDYQNYWMTQNEDTTPVLIAFGKEGKLDMTGVSRVDLSWYDENKKELVINSVDELYLFAMMSETETFEGQTIKLGTTLEVNKGTPAEWKQNGYAGLREWTPIGYRGSADAKNFKGTFDGQGHTISGIYVNDTEGIGYVGLFGEIHGIGVVRDLKLENSYFGSTCTENPAYVGSIAGRFMGTLEKVYSSAEVENATTVEDAGQYTGGLIGGIAYTSAEGAKYTITNCQFAGTVSGTKKVGGILGGVYGKTALSAKIEHCLNTGTIYSTEGQAGGLCGAVVNGTTLTLIDSLNTGNYDAIREGASKSNIASVVGIVSKATLKVTDSYGISNDTWKKADDKIAGANGAAGIKLMELDDLKGQEGYRWTKLDYEHYWMTKDEEFTPELIAFGGTEKIPTAGIPRVNTDWYKKGEVSTIDSIEDLYGFALLSATTTFEGDTIKLGRTLTVNSGTVAQWKDKDFVGLLEWTPVGYRGSSDAKHFKGTFDGQGNTIHGIYVNDTEGIGYVGLFGEIHGKGVVKDLKLENSYFNSTKVGSNSSMAYVGSIAGRFMGTLDTVYSSADVVSAGQCSGGLIGGVAYTASTNSPKYKITNCQFAGTLTGTANKIGGILGGVYGNGSSSKKELTVIMEHCLNTGTIYSSANQVGGLCGAVLNKTTLEIIDTVNLGGFASTASNPSSQTTIGAAIGIISGGYADATSGNVYTCMDNNGWISASVAQGGSNLSGTINPLTVGEFKASNGKGAANLTYYAEGKDSSSDGDNKTCWWIARPENTPVLESFDQTR